MKYINGLRILLACSALALNPLALAVTATKTQTQAVVSPQTLQKAVDTLQTEIQTVANNVPKQLLKQQALHQQQIAELEKRLQERVDVLQKQIQQVQYNLTKEVAAVQKELQQLSKINKK